MEINFQKQDIAGNLGYVWSLTSGDTGDASLHSGTADRTVQVGGTFGATAGDGTTAINVTLNVRR